MTLSGNRASHRCPGSSWQQQQRGRLRGFTLAEVLAALAFLAIVIPVAVGGLRVASLAGQVGQRKAVAARIGERVLNEWLVSNQGGAGLPRGSTHQDGSDYDWSLRSEAWLDGSMRVITVTVEYRIQGQEYDLRLSTLVGPNSL
ncbi:MAG: prepilin-type N-terminal cleavage/methylation domain-containing protein [Verrucomicrobiales bacterium]|nr:prepilin-type N-terminal cleavage/methylation domain-containing protein [Verrucomicrobiales bacterium]